LRLPSASSISTALGSLWLSVRNSANLPWCKLPTLSALGRKRWARCVTREKGYTSLLVKKRNFSAVRARPRVRDFSGIQVAALCFALLLLATIPVWTHSLPPLADYINHLARMHVIATRGKDANLSAYYFVEWQIIPNLMMDIVVPALARATNVYFAGQLFTVVSFTLIMSGVLVLNRSLFGQWSAGPHIALPLLYNNVFLVGVMNYIFGIGLALWAFAAWVWLRERRWPLRLTVSAVFSFALFFCHLFALGLYGLGLLAYETWRLQAKRGYKRRRSLLDFIASGVPLVAAASLLLASPTLQLASANEWEPRGKIDGLIYIIEVYSDVAALTLTAIFVGAIAWAIRHRLLHVHPFAWVLLVMATAVYITMPRTLFATYMADQRLPIGVAFMLLGSLNVRLHRRDVRRGFIGLVLVVLAIRIIEVDVTWAQLSATTKEFRQSVKRIKNGGKILVAYAERSGGDDVRDLGLVHAACLAMIERSALVSTAFTVRGKQILHVRPQYEKIVDTEDGTPPSVGQLIIAAKQPANEDAEEYWRTWTSSFDYVYVLFTDDDAPDPDPERLKLVHDGEKFQLYSVIK